MRERLALNETFAENTDLSDVELLTGVEAHV